MAMTEQIYLWLEEAMMRIADAYFRAHRKDNVFKWAEFVSKLRIVWRWTRSNIKKAKRRKHTKN